MGGRKRWLLLPRTAGGNRGISSGLAGVDSFCSRFGHTVARSCMALSSNEERSSRSKWLLCRLASDVSRQGVQSGAPRQGQVRTAVGERFFRGEPLPSKPSWLPCRSSSLLSLARTKGQHGQIGRKCLHNPLQAVIQGRHQFRSTMASVDGHPT